MAQSTPSAQLRLVASRARSAAEARVPDLRIDYYPSCWTSYRGTRAQLEAEGLIPDGFQWPARTASTSWASDANDFILNRVRPPSARPRPWADGDYWELTIRPKNLGTYIDKDIAEKRAALRHTLFIHSAEGRRAFDVRRAALQRAAADAGFQAFKGLLVDVESAKSKRAKRAGKRS